MTLSWEIMSSFKKLISISLLLTTVLFAAYFVSGCSMTYNGEKLFYGEGCSQCHTFKGKGGRMGPDLSAVTNLRSDSWIENYLQDPKKVNPFARMPSFKHLSSSKRKAIIVFLKQ